MRKLLLVAKAEYLRMVKRRSFLLATLGVPLFIGVIMAISIAVAVGGSEARPYGVVDGAGILGEVMPNAASQAASVRAFPDEASARAALQAREIQGFYVVPSDYLTTQQVALFYWDKAPSNDVSGQFDRLLRAALVARAPAEVRDRLLGGTNITYRTVKAGEQAIDEQIIGFLLPLFVGMFFVFVVMGSAGYLLQAVTTEKENRMAEVMFTSLSPLQLIGGKAIGLMGVAFTQIGIWLLALVAAVVVASRFAPFLLGIKLDGTFLLLVVLYFVPTYALVAGMMITLGCMVTELQQGQQIAGILNLLFLVPFFFFVLVFTNPNSPILVAMTLFPTTAFMTVAMRWGMTTIPAWQLVVGWLILVTTAALSIGVAARVFREGMLRYGQPLSLRGVAEIVRAPAAR
jgi:ABC-2 type transport system permease protein